MSKTLQAGAIPFRQGPNGLEFLLVTSKKGNWIFPKGYIDPGETAAVTARKETREEAGIDGEVLAEELGCYSNSRNGEKFEIRMFLLRYEREIEPWLEALERSRTWCSFEEAEKLLKRKAHRRMLRRAREVLAG